MGCERMDGMNGWMGWMGRQTGFEAIIPDVNPES